MRTRVQGQTPRTRERRLTAERRPPSPPSKRSSDWLKDVPNGTSLVKSGGARQEDIVPEQERSRSPERGQPRGESFQGIPDGTIVTTVSIIDGRTIEHMLLRFNGRPCLVHLQTGEFWVLPERVKVTPHSDSEFRRDSMTLETAMRLRRQLGLKVNMP